MDAEDWNVVNAIVGPFIGLFGLVLISGYIICACNLCSKNKGEKENLEKNEGEYVRYGTKFDISNDKIINKNSSQDDPIAPVEHTPVEHTPVEHTPNPLEPKDLTLSDINERRKGDTCILSGTCKFSNRCIENNSYFSERG